MIPEKPRRAVNTIIAEAVVDTRSQHSVFAYKSM
jgi:hypothetical protein